MPRHVDCRRPAPPTIRFLEDLAPALERSGRRSLWIKPKRTVAWREGDTINHVLLVRWNGSDPDGPRLTRISLNYYSFSPSARTRLLLGFDLPNHPGYRQDLRLELTVLDRELVSFAPWLPCWIAGRVDPGVAIPPPPVECHVWHQTWEKTDYAWSAAAWEAQEARRKKEEEARSRREGRRRAPLDGRPVASPAVKTATPSPSTNATPAVPTPDGNAGLERTDTESRHV